MAAYELEVSRSAEDFSAAISELAAGRKTDMVLAKFGAGLLEFAGLVFPGVENKNIFAQNNQREAEGRGPHFDVYNGFVDEDHQWLGLYNLKGTASITTTRLPDDLANSYLERYPEQSDAAYDARRHFSRIALEAPDATLGTGLIEPSTAFALPVPANGPHIVHEISPTSAPAGSFTKLIVAPKDEVKRQELNTKGYEQFDTFFTKALGGIVNEEVQPEEAGIQRFSAIVEQARRMPGGPSGRKHRPRKCNLD